MNTIKTMHAAGGLALALALAPLAATADDAATIRAGTEAWVSLFNSGNAKGAVALYTYDAVMFAPGHPTARGTAPITAVLEKEIAGAKAAGVAFALGTENEVGISGDLAWHSGTYVVKTKAGKTVDTGKYLEVWKKAAGKWRIIRDAWNSDGPPAPAAAAAAPAAPPKK